MQPIIIMPPHIIIIGMAFIIAIIFVQHSMNISLDMPSMGIMVQVMPSGAIAAVILHIIIGIMPGIMPGIPIGIGIMPPIIGICACMVIGIIGIAVFIWVLPVGATLGRCCQESASRPPGRQLPITRYLRFPPMAWTLRRHARRTRQDSTAASAIADRGCSNRTGVTNSAARHRRKSPG
jgi:hypothetical protein